MDPFAKKDAKLVVLFFISIDCPISQRYSPEIQRLEKDLAGKGVGFWLVQPNHDETAQATRAFLEEYRITTPLLRDPAHQLVRKAKATTTPEAAVFSGEGELLYHGRIDNLYADFGLKRQTATEHDLRDAISALLQGRPVPPFHSPAVGCSIRSKSDA